MTTIAINVEHVAKTFNKHTALKDVNFSIKMVVLAIVLFKKRMKDE